MVARYYGLERRAIFSTERSLQKYVNFFSENLQKRPDIHKIVLSRKLRFPPPLPRKSVNFEDFLLICTVFPHFGLFSGRGGGYMREIGTMWQIGVLTGKPCTFLVQNGSFSAFWHYKNKERLSRGLDVKWHIPSTCLDASRKWVSTGISSINRVSWWLWLETQKAPWNGQNVHGFRVRTPICHIVPVSRAYGYPPPPPEKCQFWGFSIDLYSFSSFWALFSGGGGGLKPKFADKNVMDTQALPKICIVGSVCPLRPGPSSPVDWACLEFLRLISNFCGLTPHIAQGTLSY